MSSESKHLGSTEGEDDGKTEERIHYFSPSLDPMPFLGPNLRSHQQRPKWTIETCDAILPTWFTITQKHLVDGCTVISQTNDKVSFEAKELCRMVYLCTEPSCYEEDKSFTIVCKLPPPVPIMNLLNGVIHSLHSWTSDSVFWKSLDDFEIVSKTELIKRLEKPPEKQYPKPSQTTGISS